MAFTATRIPFGFVIIGLRNCVLRVFCQKKSWHEKFTEHSTKKQEGRFDLIYCIFHSCGSLESDVCSN